MSLLGPMDRRTRRGARALVAVVPGLIFGAALAGMGAGCPNDPLNICDQPDGTLAPTFCYCAPDAAMPRPAFCYDGGSAPDNVDARDDVDAPDDAP